MATGMVLIIVTRNIDLSVGAVMAVVGMVMAVVQHDWLPDLLGLDHPATSIIAVVVGLVLGAAIGAFQGAIVAYVGVPSFIVTLGGFLVWRGVAWWIASGQTIAPMDTFFRPPRRWRRRLDRRDLELDRRAARVRRDRGDAGDRGAAARQVRLPSATDVGRGRPRRGGVRRGALAIWYLNRYYLPEGLVAQRGEPPGPRSRSAWRSRS